MGWFGEAAIVSTPHQQQQPSGPTTTLSDGRVVPDYRTIDGSLQPMTARSGCLSELRAEHINSQQAWFRMPLNWQQDLQHWCSADDVQAAEEGRLGAGPARRLVMPWRV
jgi:hypothetical protein